MNTCIVQIRPLIKLEEDLLLWYTIDLYKVLVFKNTSQQRLIDFNPIIAQNISNEEKLQIYKEAMQKFWPVRFDFFIKQNVYNENDMRLFLEKATNRFNKISEKFNLKCDIIVFRGGYVDPEMNNFISTSLDKHVAEDFANLREELTEDKIFMTFLLKRGCNVIPLKSYSKSPNQDEVLICTKDCKFTLKNKYGRKINDEDWFFLDYLVEKKSDTIYRQYPYQS